MEALGALFVGIFMALGIAAMAVFLSILRGWALSILWSWFAVPIFSLPPLSIPQAIGVSLTVGFLTAHYEKSDENYGHLIFAFVSPFAALGVGWIVKGYL